MREVLFTVYIFGKNYITSVGDTLFLFDEFDF